MEQKTILEDQLIVGAKIKIGKIYAKEHFCVEGEVLELIEGYFDYDNGLYTETQVAPAVWDEERKDFDSIEKVETERFFYLRG